jgi:hypothetical protein
MNKKKWSALLKVWAHFIQHSGHNMDHKNVHAINSPPITEKLFGPHTLLSSLVHDENKNDHI